MRKAFMFLLMLLITALVITYLGARIYMSVNECLVFYSGSPDAQWSTPTKHGTMDVYIRYGYNISCIER